jgi:hypothetical protein
VQSPPEPLNGQVASGYCHNATAVIAQPTMPARAIEKQRKIIINRQNGKPLHICARPMNGHIWQMTIGRRSARPGDIMIELMSTDGEMHWLWLACVRCF